MIGISMFDCPEHIHTSPERMSLRTVTSPSSNVILYGPPAFGVLTWTVNLPFASAVAWYVLLFHEVVTFTAVPALVVPGIVSTLFCCTTMLSVINCGNTTFASAITLADKNAMARMLFFI